MLDIATSLASIAVRQIAVCPALLAMVRQLNAKTTMAGAGSRSESGPPLVGTGSVKSCFTCTLATRVYLCRLPYSHSAP